MAIRQGVVLHVLSILFFLELTLFVCGCFSQTNKEDGVHYVAQVQPQSYPCSSCGYRIDINNINKNIRTENSCPSCGKRFFYTHGLEVNSGSIKHDQRPKIYGPSSSYYSDTNYQRFGVGGYSFKETPTGFSELSWYFHDSKVKSHRIVPHWRTTRYHYP